MNMKIIFFFLLIFLSSLSANEPLIHKKKVPLSIALPLLNNIDKHAIKIGSGPIHMYAFIDPLCPRSQDFVGMIFESEKMRERYTYHFFYYELKRFNTKNLIAMIYEEKNPIEMIKKIMIEHQEVTPSNVIRKKVQTKINEISSVAKKLDIYKRPYLFVVKPTKGKN